MNNKNTLTLGAIAVALAAVIGLSAFSFAAEPVVTAENDIAACPCSEKFKQGQGLLSEEKKEEFKARHEQVIAALEAQDYQAWAEAIGNTAMSEQVTEEEFPQLIEAHQLMQEGKEKFEQAKEIRQEIGLEMPGKKFKKGKHGFNQNN